MYASLVLPHLHSNDLCGKAYADLASFPEA
jgi:hypothetical protein